MIALGFLDIEADLLDPFRDIEIEHLLRRGHAGRRQYRDHMERHLAPAQKPDAGDRPVEGAAARPGHSVAVVQMPGAIDADPEIDLRLGEERAPGLVDQGSVGLKRMDDRQIPRSEVLDHGERVAIEGNRQHHRLAGMPHDRQAISDPARRENLGKQIAQGLGGDDRLRIPIRQIAILAIDIAKRGRLDDQQVDRRHDAAAVAACAVTGLEIAPPIIPIVPISPIVPIEASPNRPTADPSPSPRCPTKRCGDSRRRA